MGWDRLVGTGVATALKIVQWPTPFLTRHSASSVGRGYSNEQSPPRSRAYRRVHTDRSDPTILQYSDLRRYSNLTASQAKTWFQRNKAGPRQALQKQVSGKNLVSKKQGMGPHSQNRSQAIWNGITYWDALEMAKRVPDLHLPSKDLVFGKIKDAISPSQPVGA